MAETFDARARVKDLERAWHESEATWGTANNVLSLSDLTAAALTEAYEQGKRDAVVLAAGVCDAWLDAHGDIEIKTVSAQQWATDAVEDIADAIRSLNAAYESTRWQPVESAPKSNADRTMRDHFTLRIDHVQSGRVWGWQITSPDIPGLLVEHWNLEDALVKVPEAVRHLDTLTEAQLDQRRLAVMRAHADAARKG